MEDFSRAFLLFHFYLIITNVFTRIQLKTLESIFYQSIDYVFGDELTTRILKYLSENLENSLY